MAMVDAVGYRLQIKGEHTTERNDWARTNSALTFAEEDFVGTMVNAGVLPAAMRAALTKEKEEELLAMGKDPSDHKNADGGLQGEQTPAGRLKIHLDSLEIHH